MRSRATLRVERGRNRVATLLAWLLRLPRASDSVEARLIVTPRGDAEQWCRSFDGRRFDTRQYATPHGELAERVGAIEFRFRLDVEEGSLVFRHAGAAFAIGALRLAPPAAWTPAVEAREDAAGPRRLHIQVKLTVPAVGPVLTYAGTVDYEDS